MRVGERRGTGGRPRTAGPGAPRTGNDQL